MRLRLGARQRIPRVATAAPGGIKGVPSKSLAEQIGVQLLRKREYQPPLVAFEK